MSYREGEERGEGDKRGFRDLMKKFGGKKFHPEQ